MPHGGQLIVETADVDLDEMYASTHDVVQPGPYVMLAVSDTGEGMDPETQMRIFKPFFTTKGRDRGTGLGLSTVYGIAKQSGGYIWVYSEEGIGTTFKVYLPRVFETTVAKPQELAPARQVGGSETVLMVEDDPAVRKMVAKLLENGGYQVIEAQNAIEALQLCGQSAIDLLLTDVVMPNMSGPELVEQVELAAHARVAPRPDPTGPARPELRRGLQPLGLALRHSPYARRPRATAAIGLRGHGSLSPRTPAAPPLPVLAINALSPSRRREGPNFGD